MINYLAIDTSGNGLTVAVGGEKKAVSRLENCTLTHSVELMDEIEKTLEKAGLNKENIDVFACSVGPGSFTGIRIGVSTVKAFGYALNKKVLAVTSFLSLAYNVEKGRKKLAVIDARHGNYYACGYDENDEEILPPCFIDRAKLEEYSKEYLVISDTEIDGVQSIVADVESGFVKAVEANLDRASTDVETVVPLYVKKSQAEEGL